MQQKIEKKVLTNRASEITTNVKINFRSGGMFKMLRATTVRILYS